MKKKKVKLKKFGKIYRGHNIPENFQIPSPNKKGFINYSFLKDEGEILYLTSKHIQNDVLEIDPKTRKFVPDYIDSPKYQKFISQEGDIIVSDLWEKRKIYKFKRNDPKCCISHNWFLIRSQENDYLSRYLNIPIFRQKFETDIESLIRGSVFSHIKLVDFQEIEIYIISEEELKEINEKEQGLKLDEHGIYKSLSTNKLDSSQKDFIKNLIQTNFEDPVISLSKKYESIHLEFKSTLRTDIEKKGKIPKDVLIHEVIKTIGGFCNVSGGDLLIGVSDDNEIIGIEKDNFKNQDKFYKTLTEVIGSGTKPDVMNLSDVINITFHTVNKKTICRVNVKPTKEDIYVKHKNEWIFYKRKGPKTVSLRDMELVEYIKQKKKIYED